MDLLAKMATYVRVIEAGSLSTAAKQLRLSVASVSRQIAALEGEIGAPLLARTTRRMTVTAVGQDYYERSLRILRDVDEAQSIGPRGGVDGVLRLSMPVTIGFLSGMSLFRALLVRHPELRLDLRLEDRVVDLVLEHVDVAIRVAPKLPLSTEVVAHPLSTWHRVLVAAPSYLRRRGEPRTPAALGNHDALSSARDVTTERWTLTDGDTTTQVRIATRHACSAGQMLRELALDGQGIALLPHWYVAGDLEAHTLRRVLPKWQSEAVVVHALYRAARRNEQRVRVTLDHLRSTYAQIEQRGASVVATVSG